MLERNRSYTRRRGLLRFDPHKLVSRYKEKTIFRSEVDFQLEVQCRNISIFALTRFFNKNIIVYNGTNL